MMTQIAVLVTLSLLTEAVIEAIKPLLDPIVNRVESMVGLERDKGYLYLSVALGVFFAVSYRADLLLLLGLPELSGWQGDVGPILTGIITGRGSNFLHDVYNRISKGGMQIVQGDLLELTYTEEEENG